MEANQIIDHGNTTQTDSVYETSARTNSTEKCTTFYFVKYHQYEDPQITCKIEEARQEIQKKTEDIEYYKKTLEWYEDKEKTAKWQIESAIKYQESYMYQIDSKREDLFHVQNALNKNLTDYRVAMQSSEVKDLTNHISGLKHRVQKEKLTLKEEKQLIKQMKELKVDRNEIVTLVSFDNKKRQNDVVEQLLLYKCNKIPMEKWPQSITDEIDGLKARHLDARKKVRHLKHYLEEIKNHITEVLQKMNNAISERDQIDKMILKSKELAAELNACYYENDELRDHARHLAATKDIAALDELSNNERNSFCNGMPMKLSEMTTPEGYSGHLTVVGLVKIVGQETLMKVLVLYENARSPGLDLFADEELRTRSKNSTLETRGN